jgi:quercetin dioxygenase-like cupin family protein
MTELRGLLKVRGALGKTAHLSPPQRAAILDAMDKPQPMAVEVLTSADSTTLTRPGQTSVQLLWPGNSPQARVTLTRVTVPPGEMNRPHTHADAEQIWVVERGRATLLLEHGQSRPIQAGDIVRTPAGATHGLHNTGSEPLIYLAVTTPPVDFRDAYETAR